MSREGLATTLALFFALAATAQVRITGVVIERAGASSPVPVPEAYVLAKTGSPERTIAEAVTDSQGRYLLTDLPAGRVSLSVQAQGYYTVKAGGLESGAIARSCPSSGDCGATDFEVARGAVVEGWLTDAFGDPLQGAAVSLMPSAGGGVPDPMERMRNAQGQKSSDDRGYFRFWGVKPGRYELAAQERMGFRPSGPGAEEKQIIEIAPGETRVETRLALKTANVQLFSVSGEVIGLPENAGRQAGISIQPAVDSPSSFGWGTGSPLRDGKFTISGVPPGRYTLRLHTYQSNQPRSAYLDTVTVDRDVTDLRLSPPPPTGLRGRVEFVDSPAANQFLGLRWAGGSLFGHDRVEAKSPDYTFENEGLAPGEYEVALFGSDYYVVDPAPIRIVLGRVQDVVLRLSNQRSTVRGVARLASGENREAAAHFTVGMRGERGHHKVQTDDAGGFIFERVIPGDYEIAAWEAPDVDVRNEEAWQRAGDDVKRLVLEAGFETEIDLTVTP
jgi:protocatechuate 3,4-dioxygenase beta subunit